MFSPDHFPLMFPAIEDAGYKPRKQLGFEVGRMAAVYTQPWLLDSELS